MLCACEFEQPRVKSQESRVIGKWLWKIEGVDLTCFSETEPHFRKWCVS